MQQFKEVIREDGTTEFVNVDYDKIVERTMSASLQGAPIPAEELIAYEKTEYQRQRMREYPPIAEQLDVLYHGGYDEWKQMIESIKLKYPKPEDQA